jgi:hypothetical protein
MSYSINKSNGTVVATVADGVTDTSSTSLTLVGQNYVGYGEILQENLVALLENFSKGTAPRAPLLGQIWFDSTNNQLKVFGTAGLWRTLASSTAATSAPNSPMTGDIWFNTLIDKLNVYNGSSWIVIGPNYTRTQGVTQANAVTIVDNLTNSHTVLAFEVSGQTRAIFSPDIEFTPGSIVSGFPTIKQGFNISQTIAGTTYHGTVENALTLQGLEPTVFLRHDSDEYVNGNLLINDDSGLWVGTGGKVRLTVDSLDNSAVLSTHTNGANFKLQGLYNNTPVPMLVSNVATGLLTVAGNPTSSLGVATKSYVDLGVESAVSIVRNDLAANVVAINATLGVLTGEINDVNTYAQNLNTIKAPLANPALTGTPTAPNVAVTNKSSTIATTAFVHSVLPYGVILMWSGSTGTIPTGFALCDGSNGTPNLRNRFVVGAGDTFNPGTTGGNTTPTVTTASSGEHSHTGSTGSTTLTISQIPSHSHLMTEVPGASRIFDGAIDGSYHAGNQDRTYSNRETNTIGGGQGHLHSIGSDGTHTHSVILQPTLPLYYALCYIMKVV